MNSARDLTDAELQAEIERRKKAKRLAPEPLPNPDFTRLVATIKQCISEIEKEVAADRYYDDRDDRQYIYESAMEAVYGAKIWEWKRLISECTAFSPIVRHGTFGNQGGGF